MCVHTVYNGDHVIDFVSAAKSCKKSKTSKKENVPKTRKKLKKESVPKTGKKPKQPGKLGTRITINWEIFMCSKLNVQEIYQCLFFTNVFHYWSSIGA